MSILPQTTKQDYVGPFALNQVHIGHCLDLLKQLPDKCIHSVITSPPYHGLRDYGTPPIHWDSVSYSPIAGLPPITIPEQMAPLGLEPDIWAFVGHLVAIFREVKRVLRDDGTLWLNLGDSYVTSPPGNNGKHNPDTLGDGAYKRRQERQLGHGESMEAIYQKPKDLKMKDLAGIPWRVALALQADGWYLRSDCPWLKSNAMPESIRDRPTKGTENIFLLSKRERYFFDMESIKKPTIDKEYRERGKVRKSKYSVPMPDDAEYRLGASLHDQPGGRASRARRNTDWFYESLDEAIAYLTAIRDSGGLLLSEDGPEAFLVNPAAYKAAHFATFPEKLVTPMVLASTSEYGVCGVCGAPWVRVVKKEKGDNTRPRPFSKNGNDDRRDTGRIYEESVSITTGWRATCQCDAPITPAIILDPFAGSGTTLQVAIKHRRRGLGFDNNETYATDLVGDRLNGTQIQFA